MNASLSHWLRCLPLLALMQTVTAFAAPASDQPIPFTAEQIKSLGIRLSAPQPASRAAGTSLSARVIAAPDAEWVVTAPTGGVVVRVPVSEGDVIKAGTALVELRSAEAPKMSADLAHAESVAKLARAERDRDRQLHDEGIIAARRLQASEQAAAQAESALTAARMHLKLMGMTASDAGNGRVLARAPAASTVLERLVTPGQRVNEADPLLRLVDADKLMLELLVPIADEALKVGDTLGLPDGGHATVKQSGWGASELAQSIRVRATLPGGTSGLRPGQWLKVQREVSARAAWTLPTTAISRQEQDTVVFVQDAAGFRAVPVSIVAGDGANTTVTGALSERSAVATTGTIAIKGAWLGHGGSD